VSGQSPQAPDEVPALTDAPYPGRDCPICPRLVAFREKAPGKPFVDVDRRLDLGQVDFFLGGMGVANRARANEGHSRAPFTGDYAGDLLYATLKKYGFAAGEYGRSPDDGFRLIDCRITNAVRCVPPENKPTPAEISCCRPFLRAEIASLPRLEAVLALGAIAHGSLLAALGERRSRRPFIHGALHELEGDLLLADSYHCSRYNTNTGRLTVAMFESVIAALRERLG
jgi:uracil-DNA glycosylase family 4